MFGYTEVHEEKQVQRAVLSLQILPDQLWPLQLLESLFHFLSKLCKMNQWLNVSH